MDPHSCSLAASSTDTSAVHHRVFDQETFCQACKEALSQKISFTMMEKHGTFRDIVQSGVYCKFCSFIYESFAADIASKTTEEKEQVIELGVSILTANCTTGIDDAVDRIDLRVAIGDGRDALHLRRTFVVVMNRCECFGLLFRGLNRAIWSQSSPIMFKQREATIHGWLEDCRKNHTRCRRASKANVELAVRMLEVRPHKGTIALRLVSTRELDFSKTPYAVLSHCWGKPAITCITTQRNVERYYEKIELSTLAKTFREAVEITCGINIRYLWIDSLCIVQDDKDEWEQEAAKMARIYEDATITISATSAGNSQDGCGITTVFPPAVQLSSKVPSDTNTTLIAIRDSTSGPLEQEVKSILLNSPMNSRAWILQERLLSRRILHATTSLFVWQCATVIETEDGLIHETKATHGPWDILESHIPQHVLTPHPLQYNIRNRWWSWVKQYMERDLSRPEKDHYAAFAGITNHYRNLTGDEPVLGLWKRDLPIHLSWESSKVSRYEWTVSPRKPRCPSWTWITYPHGSVHLERRQDLNLFECIDSPQGFKIYYEAQVIMIETDSTPAALVAEPQYGILTLRGLHHRTLLSRRLNGWRYRACMDVGQDELDEEEREFETFALFAYVEEGRLTVDPPGLRIVGLILEATGKNQNEYRRIGLTNRRVDMLPGTKIEDLLVGITKEIHLT
ncbi:unnamed protein product [Periconia digitata]|uniref:Heterokaryon incompatibility domain-containing protein n=1 Tax=Periconia digitata TaxID=1303443 RepID=A0A9W4UNL0_9PLEO|nr:unnamed protein product [Periconia digitata]